MVRYVDVISWNVRGMGEASETHAIYTYLSQSHPAIVWLSEAQLIKNKMHLMHRYWVGHSYHSTYSSRARGVSILVHKYINESPFNVLNPW